MSVNASYEVNRAPKHCKLSVQTDLEIEQWFNPMGLNHTSSVDLITKPFPGDDCKLVLFVVDDGNSPDQLERYNELVSKLTNYLAFVSSEDFKRKNPGLTHADILIRVVCTTPPNEAMLNVQAVGGKNDAAQRLRVVFADRATFLAAHKPSGNDQ